MSVTSDPLQTPVEVSIIVFVRNRLGATRRLVGWLQRDAGARNAEWVFVSSHPDKSLMDYLRAFARKNRVKAIFTPRRHSHVYSHDANRGARCADGSLVVFLDSRARLKDASVLSAIRGGLSSCDVGIVSAGVSNSASIVSTGSGSDRVRADRNLDETTTRSLPLPVLTYLTAGSKPLLRQCYGLRQDVFWELGGFDERFEGDGIEALDLQYRALKHNYRLVENSGHTTLSQAVKRSPNAADIKYFLQKHGRRGRKSGKRFEPFAKYQAPELSIAIATHNEAPFLARSLNSVFRAAERTRVPFQVVVVNDCSTDDTRLVLEGYRQRFSSNLTLINNERRLGPARARNLALSRCTGAHVAGLEATHTFRRDKLLTCLASLRRADADFLTHDVGGSNRRAKVPAYSGWMFRKGLVWFNEQWMAGGFEEEWWERNWSRLRTIHTPLPLAAVQ